jgi:hypothetical protein
VLPGSLTYGSHAGPSVALPTQVNDKPAEEGLTIPSNEASVMTFMRPTKEIKTINLGFSDKRKTAVISSTLTDK